jgi:PRC-barrel domain
MAFLKAMRLLGTVTILVTIPLLSAIAQRQSSMSPSTGTAPAVARLETILPPVQRQTPPAIPIDRSTRAETKVSPLVGLSVFSSEGTTLGSVPAVETGTDGTTTAIYLKTGGFLGLGGKIVAIPMGKFTQDADKIDLHMSAAEVSKLPAVEEQE